MTPVHAALVRGPRRERAHHDQRPNDGRRHPGADVAAIGIDAAASASSSCAFDVDPRAAVGRVTIRRTTLEIQFAEGMTEDAPDRVLVIPWTPPSPIDGVRSFRGKASNPLRCARCEPKRA